MKTGELARQGHHRQSVRVRPAPTPDSSPASTGGLAALIDLALHEILVATYWFDPAVDGTAGPIVVRFFGHRQGAGARTKPGDQFIQDESVDGVSPGSGRVSITTRVRGVNPGEWIVSARIMPTDGSQREARGRSGGTPAAAQLYPATWSWRWWSLRKDPAQPVKTCLAPLALVPGLIPGMWPAMVVLGMLVALVAQQLVLARAGVPVTNALTISLIAIAAGLIGAKVRYIANHWGERRIEGWSIQGFLPAAAIAGAVALALAQIPVGAFVDASAPALFLGLAVGRIGCFFAGCCAGKPTGSAWGLWSSDQRVGIRRIPTHLFESALALGLAFLTLAAVLAYGPLHGAILVAGLSLYTLVRQGILQFRAERSFRGSEFIATAAAVVLIVSMVHSVLVRLSS